MITQYCIKKTILFIFLWFFCLINLQAQNCVDFPENLISPPAAEFASSVYATDVDGDGDIDMLSASWNDNKIAWYENDGNQNFTSLTITTFADGSRSVYAIDIDGDGDIDVLSASENDDKIAWYENDGNQNFTPHTITTFADGAYSVYSVDIDGDGDIDVLSASENDDKIAWYENDGNQNFTSHTITTFADDANSVYAADIDGDGDMDVLSASWYDDKIAWYENDGNQNFTSHTITTFADGAYSVYSVDIDGDGDIDVLSASENDDKIAWYENDGNQNFITHIITTNADFAISVYAVDVDGDGDMDVLSASENDNKIAWYENDGNQNFTSHTITTTFANQPTAVHAADVDGDGDIDVLSSSWVDDKIAWYENDGNQTFSTNIISTNADHANSVYAADIDGDGDMDVLSASENDNKIAWYENNLFTVDNILACDNHIWIDGVTYTSSNNSATDTLTDLLGCDSIIKLNLTMNYSNTSTHTVNTCDSYTWIDGNTYTASNNTATHILSNVSGCDSIVSLNLTINNNNAGTDTQIACNSFTWIDGNTYSLSNNTATHTISNTAGCDSVVTLNLTINHSNIGTDTQSACNSYQWIDGNTYTASNNSATHTLTNNAGCDSVVTLNLTINNSNIGTDTQSACNSYQWINGNTYTASNNTATHTLTNTTGCDSVVTLNLTINNSNTGTDIQSACDSYTWIDGNSYSLSNNTATHTISNTAGCDSVVTLNLTINNSNTGTDIQSACDSYTWIDGNTYSLSNNTATHTLSNTAGCDSVVTLNLSINNVDSSVTQTGVTLSAVVSGAAYQWLNCNNNFTIISGEINQSYTATTNGSYAIEITQNGCIDTSACYSITSVGIVENNFGNDLLIYPNPTNGNFSIDLGQAYNAVTITISDLNGKLIWSEKYKESQLMNLKLEQPTGVYLLKIESENNKAIIRVVKE